MKKILIISSFIILGLIICYFTIVYGRLEFRKNTDTPDKFVNRTNISINDYNKDKFKLISQFKDLTIKHVDFFYSKEYFEGTEIIIDTILYSPKYDKLAILIITKNPTSRQLMPDKNESWYYNATTYLGVRQNDSISLSWLGPNFSNSTDLSKISNILKEACFRTFVTKDTIGEFAHKYNLNDIRFWTSSEWQKVEKEKIKRMEFEKEKREHPENIYEPK
jgi:hypothetical protein